MKSNALIPIFFLLVLILPFVSYAQKIDSSSAQTKVESKFDSTIIIYKIKIDILKSMFVKLDSEDPPLQKNTCTMNGKEISDVDIRNCVLMFKSSEFQYHKWETRNSPFKVCGAFIRISGLMFIALPAYALIEGGNTGNAFVFAAAFSAGAIGLSIPILTYAIISTRHHFKKAIRLYNEEILKRHK
ncbi:MAG: hypothetical protein ACHQHP_00345 [Bacteroidia bacterium]